MNEGLLVRKNLTRNALRTGLLAVSITIAFLLFGALNGLLDSFDRNARANGAETRLVTINKINFTQPLPIAYFGRIRTIEGVADATHASWFGGFYQEPRNFLFTFAVDPESYLRIYKDQILLPPDQAQAFIKDRTGFIAGADVAARYGWKVGDTIPLSSNIFSRVGGGNVWEATLRGIFVNGRAGDSASAVFLHYAYFDEGRSFGNDNTGQVTTTTIDPAQNDLVARRIDALFANSPAETRTQDEAAFNRSFFAQQGDVALIIRLVVSAAFFAILMIVGNTMIMAVRERTKEIGVMKTLGFSSARILRMVLSESVLLSVGGAILGLALSAALLAGLAPFVREFFGAVSVSGQVLATGLGLALLLGLVTGVVPALNAFNMKIVDALGRK